VDVVERRINRLVHYLSPEEVTICAQRVTISVADQLAPVDATRGPTDTLTNEGERLCDGVSLPDILLITIHPGTDSRR